MKRLSKKREQYFFDLLQDMENNSRLGQSRRFFQHGSTSVFSHSTQVAYECCLLAERWHLPVDYRALIRGAVLHDYFLYDWHDKEHDHRRPHGFYHPEEACRNAREDFKLTLREENIIRRHMFPLTIIPPKYLEAWLVCIVDKVCSTRETVNRS